MSKIESAFRNTLSYFDCSGKQLSNTIQSKNREIRRFCMKKFGYAHDLNLQKPNSLQELEKGMKNHFFS